MIRNKKKNDINFDRALVFLYVRLTVKTKTKKFAIYLVSFRVFFFKKTACSYYSVKFLRWSLLKAYKTIPDCYTDEI